jgi:hypothetical protein
MIISNFHVMPGICGSRALPLAALRSSQQVG